MASYVNSIKIGEGAETPIWDTAITVNNQSPDSSTHNIALQPDNAPTSGSNNFVSSKALYNLLINNVSSIAEYSVTLSSSGWSSNNTIAVTVSDSIIDSNTILIISPAATAANISNYGKASIYCSGQGTNSLSFSCSTKPTSNITVNVLAINIRTSF